MYNLVKKSTTSITKVFSLSFPYKGYLLSNERLANLYLVSDDVFFISLDIRCHVTLSFTIPRTFYPNCIKFGEDYIWRNFYYEYYEVVYVNFHVMTYYIFLFDYQEERKLTTLCEIFGEKLKNMRVILHSHVF